MSKEGFLFDLQLYHALNNFSGDVTAAGAVIQFSNLYIPHLPVNHTGRVITEVPVVAHSK